MVNTINPEQLKNLPNSEVTESGVLPVVTPEIEQKTETLSPLTPSENVKEPAKNGETSVHIAKEILKSADKAAETAAQAGGAFDAQEAKRILTEVLKGTHDLTMGNETDPNNVASVADALMADAAAQMKKNESAVN